MEQASWKTSLGVDKEKKCLSFVSACPVVGRYWLKSPLGSVLHSTKGLEHAD